MNDPHVNSIGERILLRPNIVYEIMKHNQPAIGLSVPVRGRSRTQVRSSTDEILAPDGDILYERVLVTASVDDVPILNDSTVVNDFLIVFDSGCTTHTFNTLTYLDNYKVCKGSLEITDTWTVVRYQFTGEN